MTSRISFTTNRLLLSAVALWTGFQASAQMRIGTELGNGTEGIQLQSREPTVPFTIENLYSLSASCSAYANVNGKNEVVIFSLSKKEFVATWREGRLTREIRDGGFGPIFERLISRVPLTVNCSYAFTKRNDLDVFNDLATDHVIFDYFSGDKIVEIRQLVQVNGNRIESMSDYKAFLGFPNLKSQGGRVDITLSVTDAGTKRIVPLPREQTAIFRGLIDHLLNNHADFVQLSRTIPFFVYNFDPKLSLGSISSPSLLSFSLCTGTSNCSGQKISARWSQAALHKFAVVRSALEAGIPKFEELVSLQSFALVKSREAELLEAIAFLNDSLVPALRVLRSDPNYSGGLESVLLETVSSQSGVLQSMVNGVRIIGKLTPDYRWDRDSSKIENAPIDVLRYYPSALLGKYRAALSLGDEVSTLRGLRSTVQNARALLVAQWPSVDRLSTGACNIIPNLAGSIARFKHHYLDPIGVAVDPDFAASFYVQEIMATFKALNDFGYNNESPAQFLDQTLPQWESICASVRDQVLAEIKRFEK
jgi:hypothetical protein